MAREISLENLLRAKACVRECAHLEEKREPPPRAKTGKKEAAQCVIQLPFASRAAFQSYLEWAFGKAKGEMGKYATEAEDKVNQLLQKLNDRGIEMQILFENAENRTTLFAYSIDLQSSAFARGWNAAMNGDYLTAMSCGAFELDPGSGVEDIHVRRTSIKLDLFGLWHASTATSYFSTATVQYAGSGHFKLMYQVGGSYETQNVGALRRSDVYFAASAARILREVFPGRR